MANHTEMAYDDTTGHLLAELDRIARLLEGYGATLEPGAEPAGRVDAGDGRPPAPEDLPYAVPDDIAADLERRVEERRAGVAATPAATTLRLEHLVEAFGLGERHRDVLLLALLPTARSEYQEVFAELHNDLAATQPTVGLVADLFSRTDGEFLVATRLVGPGSPLHEHDLIRLGDPDDTRLHLTERPVFLEERVESYLLGQEGMDPLLEGVLEVVEAAASLESLRVDAALRARLEGIADGDGTHRFYWHGPPGTGKRRAAEAVVAGDRLLRADLPAALEAGLLERVRREALLLDRPLHLTGAGAADAAVDGVLETFEGFERDLLVTGTEEWTPDRPDTAPVDAIVEFPRPGFELRRSFWADNADDLPDGLDPTVLAGTFELTQGEMEAALATARSLADGAAPTADQVYEGCSAQSAGGLSELAEELEPDAGWDDIELPADTMRELRTVAAHVTNRGRIYHEWGFAERFSRGTGVVALFSGASGTGKTMAAEILAAAVGMRLFKIDLSSVVSKYIGETEENLERIFTEAEHSNAILLFDEADAVFGDRAAVSDATDRYANVEVNYLLQRIESYGGVVLLTTNYESNIDSAFMRRVDHSVTFQRPDEETRRAIWESIFPPSTPVAELDHEFLADFKLTGGDIRTVAQTAAILAATDDGTVRMAHVVRGLQRELRKSGKMVDPQQFGDYQDRLRLE